jgi:hypothetical protein
MNASLCSHVLSRHQCSVLRLWLIRVLLLPSFLCWNNSVKTNFSFMSCLITHCYSLCRKGMVNPIFFPFIFIYTIYYFACLFIYSFIYNTDCFLNNFQGDSFLYFHQFDLVDSNVCISINVQLLSYWSNCWISMSLKLILFSSFSIFFCCCYIKHPDFILCEQSFI